VSNRRREIEVFSLSFLDVICCGFGGVILLLVISMALEPATLERLHVDLSDNVARIEEARAEIVEQSRTLQERLSQKQATVSAIRLALDSLDQQLEDATNDDRTTELETSAALKEELEVVLQTLTDEMKNLLSQEPYEPPSEDAVIGGIPVDSEYIFFVIDTSGSMLLRAWPTVIRKVEEVLDTYPNVKGLQVVSDNRGYMFPAYMGRWIPDTPARRRAVITALRGSWARNTPSNSSPVEGITHALRMSARTDAPVSIYVFGDDFDDDKGGSIDRVLREVERINTRDRDGNTRIRVHTFGFPVYYRYREEEVGRRRRFAHLMRLMAEQNSGSFVGLTDAPE